MPTVKKDNAKRILLLIFQWIEHQHIHRKNWCVIITKQLY